MDASTNTGTQQETRIFVSYAREDAKWLDKSNPHNLIPFLMESLRRHNVNFWFDKELKGGDVFEQHIAAEIDNSQIALLIVSQSFLNSEFIENKEMPRILERARQGKMIVIPVLVEECLWSEYSFLADRQMVPGPMPLIDYTESEASWSKIKYQILSGIKIQVERLRKTELVQEANSNRTDNPRRERNTKSGNRFVRRSIVVSAMVCVLAVAVIYFWSQHKGASTVVPAADSMKAAQSAAPDKPIQPMSIAPQERNHDSIQAVSTVGQQSTKGNTGPIGSPQSQPSSPQQDSLFDLGRHSYKLKDYTRARVLFTQSCNSGETQACFFLGELYANGLGGERNIGTAFRIHQNGCDKNEFASCAALGILNKDAGQTSEAQKNFLKACNGGITFVCEAHAHGGLLGAGMRMNELKKYIQGCKSRPMSTDTRYSGMQNAICTLWQAEYDNDIKSMKDAAKDTSPSFGYVP